MTRSIFALAALVVAACTEPPPVDTSAQEVAAPTVTREHVAGDVYHYRFVVPVGAGPNAQLRIHRVVRERAPGIPRRTTRAIMALHGDFAQFTTNFLPSGGMASWLAARDLDVWGVDRRYVNAAQDGDRSDFDAMGLDQELDDVGAALAFARGVRLVTDASAERLTLVGFSRGGMLAYYFTAREASRPAILRQVKGLVPLDVYASLAPADEELRQFNCDLAAGEYAALARGEVEVPNEFQRLTGELALGDPGGQSPFFPFPVTNREWMLSFLGETYYYFAATPRYHLIAPILDDDTFVVGLRTSSEAVVATWLAGTPAYQSMRESADTDALICGDTPRPELALARIKVPLLLIAAAGGYGDHAIFSTTQVASTDVTTRVIRQLPVEREAEDFGHGDLLYAPDAPALAWQPLLAWLRSH